MTTAERAARIAQLQARLTAIDTSITTIIAGGQAYSGEGRALTRADLAQLRAMEADTQSEISKLQRGSGPRMFGAVYR